MTLLAAGALAKHVLAMLAMMAVHGTLLALVAWAITRGRSRPAWAAAVWLVVLVKFALPWGPAMPYSLSDLVAGLTGTSEQVAATVEVAAKPAIVATPSLAPSIGWLALAALWAAGTLVVLARAIAKQRRASRAAREAAAAPDHVVALLAALAARMRVRVPRVVVGGAETGPHVIGVLRPIIVIPPTLVTNDALLRAALMHELAHVRRRDGIGRLVQIWVGALYFYFPIVPLVSRRLELARERACDAWALEACELPRPAYARLLVQMAALHSHAPALAAPHALDARVAAVLAAPSCARIGWPARGVLVAWIVVALGGARSAAARGHKEVCHYTPELAASLFNAYPEADLDGDGTLSRDEACDLQAELRRHAALDAEAPLASLLEQPLCCNCDEAGAYSSPDVASCAESPLGVDR